MPKPTASVKGFSVTAKKLLVNITIQSNVCLASRWKVSSVLSVRTTIAATRLHTRVPTRTGAEATVVVLSRVNVPINYIHNLMSLRLPRCHARTLTWRSHSRIRRAADSWAVARRAVQIEIPWHGAKAIDK